MLIVLSLKPQSSVRGLTLGLRIGLNLREFDEKRIRFEFEHGN